MHTQGTCIFNVFVYRASHLCEINQFHFLHCRPLSATFIFDQFVHKELKGLVLKSQVFYAHQTSSLDLRLPVFSLTAGRYLSSGFPSVSADIVLPLFVILIYQLSFIRPPSCHYSPVHTHTHSHDTVVTESGWGGGERLEDWLERTEEKMISYDAYRLSMRFSACI